MCIGYPGIFSTALTWLVSITGLLTNLHHHAVSTGEAGGSILHMGILFSPGIVKHILSPAPCCLLHLRPVCNYGHVLATAKYCIFKLKKKSLFGLKYLKYLK